MTAEGEKNRFMKSPSPYYLYLLEGLISALIMATIFDEKNFDLRERAVRTALELKNRRRFIEGTLICKHKRWSLFQRQCLGHGKFYTLLWTSQ